MKKLLQLLFVTSLVCSITNLQAFDLIEEAKKGNSKGIKEHLESFSKNDHDQLRDELNKKGRYGWTALEYAIDDGHVEVVKLLLAAGERVGSLDVWTDEFNCFFHSTIHRGNSEMTKVLIDAGAQIDSIDEHHRGDLHFAVSRRYYSTEIRHIEVVQALLAAGTKVDLKNQWDKTALDCAKKDIENMKKGIAKDIDSKILDQSIKNLQIIIMNLEKAQYNYFWYRQEGMLPKELEEEWAVMNRYFYDLCSETNALENGKFQTVYRYYLHHHGDLNEFARLLKSGTHIFTEESTFFTETAGYKVSSYDNLGKSRVYHSDVQRALSLHTKRFGQDKILEFFSAKKMLDMHFRFK